MGWRQGEEEVDQETPGGENSKQAPAGLHMEAASENSPGQGNAEKVLWASLP